MAERALLKFLLGLLGSGLLLSAAAAGQASASFSVSLRLGQVASNVGGSLNGSGTCGSVASRSVVSVGCPSRTTGTPLQIMAFTNRETQVSTFDVYTGGARILGWQVLSLDDREYLEMTLGW